jgi:hypothetical protein
MRPVNRFTESWDDSLIFWSFIGLAAAIPFGLIVWIYVCAY